MKILAKGNSMLPCMHDGQYYDIEESEANNFLVGDIIAFYYDEMVISHRIVKIIKTRGTCFYFTKGDNNDDIDDFAITEEQILGKVIL